MKKIEEMTLSELSTEEKTCNDLARYRAIVARIKSLQAQATEYKVTLNSGGGLQITVHLPSGIANINVQSLSAANVIFGADDPLGDSIRADVRKVLALPMEEKAKLVEAAKAKKLENEAKEAKKDAKAVERLQKRGLIVADAEKTALADAVAK